MSLPLNLISPKSPVAPPPPPPPLLSKSLDCSNLSKQDTSEQCGIVMSETFSTQITESRKACKYFAGHSVGSEAAENYMYFSSYVPVTPVLQNGPRCGLVALAMASELTNGQPVTTEVILEEAQNRGFSKQGEMFSAEHLDILASHFLTCSTVRVAEEQNKLLEKLIMNLLKKNFILISYDADKDHRPCNKKGHKAHWALVTGFFFMLSSNEVPHWLLTHCERDTEVEYLYYWTNQAAASIPEQTAKFLKTHPQHIHVFGHHGKSKFAGLWSMLKLLASNNNLTEASPDRSVEDYVIPGGGMEAGLRNQFIVIDSQLQSSES